MIVELRCLLYPVHGEVLCLESCSGPGPERLHCGWPYPSDPPFAHRQFRYCRFVLVDCFQYCLSHLELRHVETGPPFPFQGLLVQALYHFSYLSDVLDSCFVKEFERSWCLACCLSGVAGSLPDRGLAVALRLCPGG